MNYLAGRDVVLRPLRFTADVPGWTAFARSLGLTPRIESLRGGWADLVAGGGGMLALHEATSSDTRQPAGRTTLSFECDDGTALVRRLRAAGYQATLYDESYGRVVVVQAPDGTIVQGDERTDDLHGYRESRSEGALPGVRVRARVVTPDVLAYAQFAAVLGVTGIELVQGPVQTFATALGQDGRTRPAALCRVLLDTSDVAGGEVLLDPDGEQLPVRPATRPTGDGVRVERVDLLADADAFAALQSAALRTVSDATGVGARDGDVHYAAHSTMPGFAAAAVREGDTLLGYAYGYREQPGSWWDGWVRPHLTAAGRGELLDDAFALVELMVDPSRHRTGLGRRLVDALLSGRPEPRVLLTTQAGANPALGFYARLGFTQVAEGPTNAGAGFVVLAREHE